MTTLANASNFTEISTGSGTALQAVGTQVGYTISGAGGTTTSASGSTITITTPAGGLTWTDVTGTSATMAVNNGYIADNAGLVTLTLPATAALGSVFAIVGKGAGGWTIAQASGQTIKYGSTTTTTTTGTLSSNTASDCVTLVCTTANTVFTAWNGVGTLTVV